MKTYPAGTRWTVSLPCSMWPHASYPDTDQTQDRDARYTDSNRYSALACLYGWRAHSATPDAIRLIVIPPPKPRRTVEGRIAEAVAKAVDERTRKVREWAAERGARSLAAFLDTLPHAGDVPQGEPERTKAAVDAAVAKARTSWESEQDRAVEERVRDAVASERADRDREHMRQLQEFQEAAKAREAGAVQERTEAILDVWLTPYLRPNRTKGQTFGEWLRDLRDGKVTT